MFNILDFKPFFLNKSHFTPSKIDKHLIRPNNNFDTLFWCFYILKHGYSKYETVLQSLTIICEKQIKIEYIQQIRSNKPLLKTLKHQPLSHYENQLTNMDKIDLYTFFLLCHLENINILYIVDRCFYSTYEIDEPYIDVSVVNSNNTENKEEATMDMDININMNTNSLMNIVRNMNEYNTDDDTDESELSDIDIGNPQYIPILHKDSTDSYYLKYTNSKYVKWNTLCKIYKLHQPIPPISYYTLSHLQQLYRKINHKMPVNFKKQDLYNELQTILKLI